MRTNFKVVAVIMLLWGGGWVIRDTVRLSHQPPAPEVLGFGPGFAGSAKLPLKVIQAKFSSAESRMQAAQTAAQRYTTARVICKWVALFATAGVTVVLGFFGHARAADPAVLPSGTNSIPLTRRSVRWIGGLAAIASVLTGLAGELTEQATQASSRADSLHRLLADSRQQVQDAPNARAAQGVLDELDYQSNKP